ncbi:undecaprenyl-diphosphate phosphatase [Chloroflexota bacterium]
MNFIHGLIIGAIQGITEWLPVSSEGVISLVLINVFNLPASEAVILAIWLHLGTLLAAIFYFRREIEHLWP